MSEKGALLPPSALTRPIYRRIVTGKLQGFALASPSDATVMIEREREQYARSASVTCEAVNGQSVVTLLLPTCCSPIIQRVGWITLIG